MSNMKKVKQVYLIYIIITNKYSAWGNMMSHIMITTFSVVLYIKVC